MGNLYWRTLFIATENMTIYNCPAHCTRSTPTPTWHFQEESKKRISFLSFSFLFFLARACLKIFLHDTCECEAQWARGVEEG